jgi:hypothetical protein
VVYPLVGIGGAAGEVDQDPVEAVAAGEGDVGVGDGLVVQREVGGVEAEVDEVVTDGELAHDGDAVRHLAPHGGDDAFA